MADVTANYSLPYQELGDSPDGASLGQDLAEAVDTVLLTKADAATNSNAPVTVSETTTLAGQTATSFAAGSPVCGVTFVAPDTGKVYATVSGEVRGNATDVFVYLSFEIRTGGTIGSGTVHTAASIFKAVVGGAVSTGASDIRHGGSRECLITGLTPGSTYNIRTMHEKTGAGAAFNIYNRELLIKMVAE